MNGKADIKIVIPKIKKHGTNLGNIPWEYWGIKFLIYVVLVLFININVISAHLPTIGETQKQFKYRIFQHKGVSCRTGNRLTCPPNSNIRQHALDFNPLIKLENFKLVNNSNKYEIRIVESTLNH